MQTLHFTNIDSKALKKCFIAGTEKLDAGKEYINSLNVFPVPDGDTGTNMTLTAFSALKALETADAGNMDSVCKALSGGSLRGARGNSGVILSQLLRGFSKTVREYETIDAKAIAEGFNRAVTTAYKAVMKPKEGTILTVAKAMAEKSAQLVSAEKSKDIELIPFFEAIIASGNDMLIKTPDMLPVLKEAGVVDSGGKGLMVILEGSLDCLKQMHDNKQKHDSCGSDKGGEASTADTVFQGNAGEHDYSTGSGTLPGTLPDSLSTDDIKYGYCTEFLINLSEPVPDEKVDAIVEYLQNMGDSLVCVADDDIIKIHVHTNHPGLAFEKGLELGSLTCMKVDNMRVEHEEKLIKDASAKALSGETVVKKPVNRKKQAIVAVCAGAGLSEIFRELGASDIIEGGQSMNPSTDDIMCAIEHACAEEVFILPNNSNVILAAQQAASLCDDCRVFVIPSKTIPQGISALLGFHNGYSADSNVHSMTEALSNIRSGEITYSVRDTVMDNKEIKEGDYIGISDGSILAAETGINEAVLKLLEGMVTDTSELITIYSGCDISDDEVHTVKEQVEKRFPDCEVEVQNGGQPVYYYYFSVE